LAFDLLDQVSYLHLNALQGHRVDQTEWPLVQSFPSFRAERHTDRLTDIRNLQQYFSLYRVRAGNQFTQTDEDDIVPLCHGSAETCFLNSSQSRLTQVQPVASLIILLHLDLLLVLDCASSWVPASEGPT